LLVFPWLDPARDLPSTAFGFAGRDLIRVLIAFVLVAPVAVLFGRQFPVAVRCCASRFVGAGRLTGRAYAINTLGTILGSLGTGFVLIPWLGVANTLLVLATFNVVLGIVLLTY